MLARVEEPPACLEWNRIFGAQQSAHRRISIRKVPPRNLVVALILEPRYSREPRVDGGGRVAPLRQNSNRTRSSRCAVVYSDVEEKGRIQRVRLGVERVAAVLHKHHLILRPESSIVEARMSHVAQIKEFDCPGIGTRRKRQLHD